MDYPCAVNFSYGLFFRRKAMLLFIKENIATFIVIIIVAIMVIAAVFKMIKDKKNGKRCCGCEKCAMKENCHKKNI